jgi:hypothetical protein
VVHKGSPDFPIDRIFPFLAVFAVANTALINMLMASRLIYGVANLSGTTAFLLLCVFTVVNVACLVLRRKRDPNRKVFFTSPGQLPLLAALLCAFLAGPWVGRNIIQYQIAGGLMAIGILLWFVTWLISRRTNAGPGGPVGLQNIGKDGGKDGKG